ncbi:MULTISPECIES: hypothetical protein [unclassified Caballeronia]|uniref:hypothetical protein n=1 Tax=unclassified Caballeronia TaxID=2646786 RepID=UPI00285D4FF1|nr:MULTISPECIES: hypothetical protein [unclassified Caballeronia]MDR5738767.1 hypothetical protein [Caballeronia sp. LZ016]MDR5811364.1 hypothetical protein [Caballeronia sp. LZ019]
MSIIDARGVYAYCAASYIVTPKGKQVLRQLFAESCDVRTAVDILYRDWIASGRLVANVTIPFLATPPFLNASTIPYEKLASSVGNEKELLLANAIRRLLFAGDHQIDLTEIGSMLRGADSSKEYKLGMQFYEACRSFLTSVVVP